MTQTSRRINSEKETMRLGENGNSKIKGLELREKVKIKGKRSALTKAN